MRHVSSAVTRSNWCASVIAVQTPSPASRDAVETVGEDAEVAEVASSGKPGRSGRPRRPAIRYRRGRRRRPRWYGFTVVTQHEPVLGGGDQAASQLVGIRAPPVRARAAATWSVSRQAWRCAPPRRICRRLSAVPGTSAVPPRRRNRWPGVSAGQRSTAFGSSSSRATAVQLAGSVKSHRRSRRSG